MTGSARTRSAYAPFAALALLALIWGYNWVVMKVGVKYSDPFTFSALRNFLGALALFAIVALRGGPFRPRPFWLLCLFAIFQTSMSGLSVWALQLGSAGKTSVLTYTMPFWLIMLAWPILGERIRGVQWIAVILALGGLIFVLEPWGLRGLTAGLLAVAGGHVDIAATNPGNVKPFVASGKVRVLAISAERRLADFPDVPTYKERGWNVVRYQWRGMMGKAGLPKPVLDRLLAAMQKTQQSAEWKSYLEQVTQIDGFMGPAEFQALLQKDIGEFLATKKKLGLL